MYEIAYYGDDGCIRYLGDMHLKHFNHNHDKLGRFSTSNGAVRAANKIDRLQGKIDNRQAKIDKLNTKIKSNRNQKRLAKAAKYDAKLLKATRKARRASMKKAAGKTLSERDQKRLMKVEKLKAKSAGKTYKNEKWEAKVANLNYKNLKNQKKIDNLVDKYGTKQLDEARRNQRIDIGRKYIEQGYRQRVGGQIISSAQYNAIKSMPKKHQQALDNQLDKMVASGASKKEIQRYAGNVGIGSIWSEDERKRGLPQYDPKKKKK